MSVNIKKARRRELHFQTLAEVLEDAQAVTAGPHHTSGNHTAADLIYHIAVPIDKAVNGFDFDVPLPMKVFGRALKLMGVDRPLKPGIQPPANLLPYFWPAFDISVDDGLNYLRRSVENACEPGRMTHPSPLFGKLTHDQWTAFNCRHAELHLSFIHPED